jgi:hypothetical protein
VPERLQQFADLAKKPRDREAALRGQTRTGRARL